MAEGHFVCYVDRDFKQESLDAIETANKIIEEYEGQGVPMSLRQLYYQMVARNLLPNVKGSYDKLGNLINAGRLAGLVSWTAIEDRNRQLIGYQTFNGPEKAVEWLRTQRDRTD